MLKKRYKLNGKDIDYLYRKHQIIYGKFFSFIRCKQYPNKKYNQFSLQVPTKLSKKATTRNHIKRTIYRRIKKQNLTQALGTNSNYYKIFCITNKKRISELKKYIETKDKKFIKNKIQKSFEFSFNNVVKKLGKKQ